MTARAIASPYTTILGNMTGRQLLRRPGAALDIERVLAACAKRGVAVEINANPWRLDLGRRLRQLIDKNWTTEVAMPVLTHRPPRQAI
jgi:histidinol phosphatase-like PHP family hydrolase